MPLKQIIAIVITIAVVIFGAVLGVSYLKSSLPDGIVEVETPGAKAMQDQSPPASLTAKIGIGTSAPEGSVHVKNALKNTPGVLLEMPFFEGGDFCWDEGARNEEGELRLPQCGISPDCYKNRLAYTYGVPMQWQGGEQRFGKWRQFFNWDEHDWTISYNGIFDYTTNYCTNYHDTNGFRGKDVEDISNYMRFDITEGRSGFWEMHWSKVSPAFVQEGNLNPGLGRGTAGYVMTAGCGAAAAHCSFPGAQLGIYGSYGMGGVLSLKSGTDGINFRTKFGKIFTIDNMSDKPLMSFNFSDSNFGNVGIGAGPGPTHKLTVAGTAGLTTGTAWTQISDSRYKDVQSELKGNSLEKIMNLHPVSYQWNSLYQDKYGEKDGLNYGFVAQDVQKVIPEFVSQDNEGYLWYNPSGFEAILTAAIQERQKQIDALRAEIMQLKSNLINN